MSDDSGRDSYDFKRILKEMRKEYWLALEEVEDDQEIETSEYVLVRIHTDLFALEAASCREVLRPPRIVKVPRAGKQILGIINIRGEIIAVTDLRPALGYPALQLIDTSRLVVVRAAGLTTALLVDRVEGIEVFNSGEIETLTEGLTGARRDIVRGQFVRKDELVVLLDLEKMFASRDFVVDQKEDQSF
jgi:purine-binding chemotaxis protein CheW